MTRQEALQEALEEIKERITNADSTNSDYCDCISKKALIIAKREIQDQKIRGRIQDYSTLLEAINERLIQHKEKSITVTFICWDIDQKNFYFDLVRQCDCDIKILEDNDLVMRAEIIRKPN